MEKTVPAKTVKAIQKAFQDAKTRIVELRKKRLQVYRSAARRQAEEEAEEIRKRIESV